MDTSEVAARLGTTARTLRQFLRSPMSTFVAVGSGARYDFTEKDIPMLEKRFSEWQGAGKPRPNDGKSNRAKTESKSKTAVQRERDEVEWAEEGPVIFEDIRHPAVRARVQRDARAAEDRLMMMLLSANLHITQLGDRKIA